MKFLENGGTYFYLLLLGMVGGVLGIIHNNKLADCKTTPCIFATVILGCVSSVFVGYISFEICAYYSNSERLSLAIASICAWIGTDVLLIIKTNLLELIKAKGEKIIKG